MIALSRGAKRVLWAAIGALLVGAACFALVNRLAFRSNESIKQEILRAVEGKRGLSDVTAALRGRYEVLSEGVGPGPDQVTLPDDSRSFVHVLVGSYRGAPMEVAVDAIVVIGNDGLVRDVRIRRSVEGL